MNEIKSKYHIIWQHWKPPFEDEYGILNKNNLPPGFVEIKSFPGLDVMDDNDDDEESDDKRFIKAVTTPMGIFPLNENYNPFNFWIGHTNFKVTGPVGDIIQAYPGIESFNPLTPYRFRIAVGRAFNCAEVRFGLQNSVYDFCNKLDSLINFQLIPNQSVVLQPKEELHDGGISLE